MQIDISIRHKPRQQFLLLSFLLFILSTPGYSQMAGATMSYPIDLGTYSAGTYTFSDGKYNMGYGNDYYGEPSEDIYYRFTVYGETTAYLTLNASVPGVIYLLNSYGSQINYNSDNIGGTSSTIYSLISAGTYYIVIEGLGYNTGYLNLEASLSVSGGSGTASEGVNTSNAIFMGAYNGGPFTYTDSRSNATVNGYGNDYGQPSDDVFYKFTVGSTASVTVSTCGSGFDTYLYLLDANGGLVTSNDDSGPSCNPSNNASLQANNLQAGTYYIVVEGYGTSSGTYNLSVSGTVTGAQATEGVNMSNAIVIGNYSSGTYTYNDTKNNSITNGYQNDIGQPSDDIYYKLTVQDSADLDIPLCGSSFDTYLHLLNSSGSIIQSNDDSGPLCTGVTSSIKTKVAAGTYYIVTEGYYTNSGDLVLSVTMVVKTQTPTPPPGVVENKNFIKVWEAKYPTAIPYELLGKSAQDVSHVAQYFDGLGRLEQTVVRQGSLNTETQAFKDLVTPVEYDEFGRQAKKYLPYVSAEVIGQYKPDAITQQGNYYSTAPHLSGQGESKFYSLTVFEASPLNRVLESYAPGKNWAETAISTTEDGRHGIKTKYRINGTGDNVRIWEATDNPTSGQWGSYATTRTYPAGELYKNVTQDEHNKQVVEFKDKEGKVVLKKVQLTAPLEDSINGSGHTGWMCTYYIYDDLGNLRCVIQPEGVKAMNQSGIWQLTPTILAEQCFRYEYDGRQRMIKKQVPGASEVLMVYDKRDRLVLTQDGNQRSHGGWLYTRYDELNRPIVTGKWQVPDVNTYSFDNIRTAAGASTTYTDNLIGTTEELTRTWYDDYNWVTDAQWGVPSGLHANFDPLHNSYPHPTSLAPMRSNLPKMTGPKE